MALTEYRLADLARVSGVSARNIRAYRERGLLDAPRREGRSAFYGAHHVAQLQTINDLLARGFTSAHIAEFFETVRSGGDLAELLGLERAMVRPEAVPGGAQEPGVAIDAGSLVGKRLVEVGLARRSGVGLVFTSAEVGAAVAGSPDPAGRAEVVLHLLDAIDGGVEAAADNAIAALRSTIAPSRAGNVGPPTRPAPDLAGVVRAVVVDRVDRALRRRLAAESLDVGADSIGRGPAARHGGT